MNKSILELHIALIGEFNIILKNISIDEWELVPTNMLLIKLILMIYELLESAKMYYQQFEMII